MKPCRAYLMKTSRVCPNTFFAMETSYSVGLVPLIDAVWFEKRKMDGYSRVVV